MSDPANNLKAMLERVARAGNVGGMALDAANTLYNGVDTYSYNRGFSLDSRIMLMSQATNIAQAMELGTHGLPCGLRKCNSSDFLLHGT